MTDHAEHVEEARAELRELWAGRTDEEVEAAQRGLLAIFDLGRQYVAGDPYEVPTGPRPGSLLDQIARQAAASDSAEAKAQAIDDAEAALAVLAKYARKAGLIVGRAALSAAKDQFGG